jgi:hypothetical protein
MRLKWKVLIAMGFLLALGGFWRSYRVVRSTGVTLNLDEGIMACGFTGRPAVPPSPGTGISFGRTELTLQAKGRTVFSGPVERIECYRDPQGRRGFPGGDAILVALTDAQLEETVARWGRICQQFGATQEDLRMIDKWAADVTQTERAGRNSQELWLQHSCSIPGTDIGVYVQSIPANSELPLVYGSHFTLFWEESTPP